MCCRRGRPACREVRDLGRHHPWGGQGTHLPTDLFPFIFFSDVLCPSVRVEGDRFKHTNGETKEITGKRGTAPLPHTQTHTRTRTQTHTHTRAAGLDVPFAGPACDPPRFRSGLADPALSPAFHPSPHRAACLCRRRLPPVSGTTVKNILTSIGDSVAILWEFLHTTLSKGIAQGVGE